MLYVSSLNISLFVILTNVKFKMVWQLEMKQLKWVHCNTGVFITLENCQNTGMNICTKIKNRRKLYQLFDFKVLQLLSQIDMEDETM